MFVDDVAAVGAGLFILLYSPIVYSHVRVDWRLATRVSARQRHNGAREHYSSVECSRLSENGELVNRRLITRSSCRRMNNRLDSKTRARAQLSCAARVPSGSAEEPSS